MKNISSKIPKSNRVRKFSYFALVVGVILSLYVIIMAFSLLWSVITTFKFQDDFVSNVTGLPSSEFGWTFSNYELAFLQFWVKVNGKTKVYLEMMLVNSIIYAGGCAFFGTLTPCITSYLVAKFRFRFSKVVYAIVIVTMIIPIVGSLPSEYSLVQDLGFKNNIFGMYIMKANFLGLYFLVFYASWKSMPNDFMEAGRVDGMNDFQILLRVMLPLVSKIFGIIYVLLFIGFWNDYQVPMLYIPNMPTAAYGLYDLFNGQGAQRNDVATDVMKLTLATVVMVPILIVFIFLKNKLIGNLTVGGIKG